jgi:hypothetical protein
MPQEEAMQMSAARKVGVSTWEGIWYVIQCIPVGAGYFAKIPVKKALQDYGLVEMTGAERFWYVLQCIAFGAGYFAKIPASKALSELSQYRAQRQAGLGVLAHVGAIPTLGSAETIPTPGGALPAAQNER